ncbi:MAG: HAD family phosphatase [Alphaproteobacteria bacterium]
MTFQAILWDCDGVLIDSEIIACRVTAEHLTAAGYAIDTHTYITRFAGQSRQQVHDIILKESGVYLDQQLNLQEIAHAVTKAFEAELIAIEGVAEVLALAKAKGLPMAVASGSGLARLEQSLKLTQLWDYFDGHVYSAEQVAHGKPAPDIFLFAAEKLGVNPKACLVVEDGVHGTHAGKAAGCKVFGFYGASHGSPAWAQTLHNAGADKLFDEMRQLPALMG